MAKKPTHLQTVTEAFAYLKECGQLKTINHLLKHEAATAAINAHVVSLLKIAELVFDRGMGEQFNSPRNTGTEIAVRNLSDTHTMMAFSTVMRRKQPQGERCFVWVDYYHGDHEVATKMVELDRYHGTTHHPEFDPLEHMRLFLEKQVTSSYTELMGANVVGMIQSYQDLGYKCVYTQLINGHLNFVFTNPKAHYPVVNIVYNHLSLLTDLATSMGMVTS